MESEIINALLKIGAIESVSASRLRFASRTDRGVSAMGNVAAFDTDFHREALLRAVNSAVEDVYVYGLAEVPRTFTPRRAQGRWYRYIMSSEGLDMEKVVECSRLFEGKHDFHRFCKPEGRSTIKTLQSVSAMALGDSVVIDLKAREFLRNMVRRLVASMIKVGEGKVSLDDVSVALDGCGPREVSFGLAAPEGLTLMDIDYGFTFDMECPPTMRRRAEESRRDALARLLFTDTLLDRCQG